MLNDNTQLIAVLGRPVRPTPVPGVLNKLFMDQGLEYVCLPFECREALAAVRACKELGVAGAAVTIPFKENIIAAVDIADEATARIGAANTVFRQDGKWLATNTDWLGVLAALGAKKMEEATCVVLGAGGAAKAAVYAAKHAGACVHVLNRTYARAKHLANALGVEQRFCALAELGKIKYDVLINATSVGLYDSQSSIVSEKEILSGSVIVDFVFSPARTKLLSLAEDRGCLTIDGISILAGQAIEQIKLWTGFTVEFSDLDAAFRCAPQGERGEVCR